MDAYVTVLTILGLTLTIGHILNGVFIDETFRLSFSSVSTKSRSNHQILLDILANFQDKFYAQFLSEKILSKRYITRSAILSLASILVILIYQHLYSLSTIGLFLTKLDNIFFFLALLTTNLLIDYLSIAQTQVFIEFARSSKSIGRSIIAIVFDLLVTVNGFILLFSATLSIIVILFLFFALNPLLRDTSATIEYKVAKTPLEEIQDPEFPLSGYEYSYNIIGQATVDKNDANVPSQNLLFASFIANDTFFNPLSIHPIPTGASDYQIRFQSDDYTNPSEELLATIRQSEQALYDIKRAYSIAEIPITLDLIYRIFSQVDLMEDAFLTIIRPFFGTVSTQTLLGIEFRYGTTQFERHCLYSLPENEIGTYLEQNIFESTRRLYDRDTECPNSILFIAGHTESNEATNYFWKPDLLEAEVPIYTFFLSTLTTTLILYAYIASLFIGRLLVRLMLFCPQRLQTAIESHPITLTFALLGVISSVVYLF